MKLFFPKSFCLLLITSVFFAANAFADIDNKTSKYHIQTGTTIQATLLNGIDASLTGTISAKVEQDIYDTATEKHLLIPKGSKLIGEYESHNVHDQRLQNLRYAHIERRIAVWFTRIIYPNGTSILLGNPGNADLQGKIVVEENIDSHLRRIVDAATVSTIISIGMGSTGTNDAADMPPTITLSPGYKFTVYVKKNMILTPYKAGN